MGNLLDEIYRSEDLLCKGLHEINDKGELNAQSLGQLGELLDAAKDMYTIQMKAEYEDGYSERGYDRYSNDWNRYDGRSYGQSYARRRDSRGRYSRDGYSRDNMNDELISMLEEKMRSAATEDERERYRRKILELENGH